MNQKTRRLELLDCGRFLAAIAVLVFHYFFNGIYNGKISTLSFSPFAEIAKYGYLGVEFFFMISGYVIFFSAQNRTASEFAVSRAVRLYPAFWIAVPLTTVVSVYLGGTNMSVGPLQALANLTMVPTLLGFDFVDGVYWTLQLELNFYALILLCLLFLERKLELILLLWPLAILAALLLGVSKYPYLGGYYSYFAAGAIFAIAKNKPSRWTIAALLICFGLCLNFSAGPYAKHATYAAVGYSPSAIGCIVTALFVFFVILNMPRFSTMQIRGSRLMGGLTYPIYLIHAHIGYMILSRFGSEQHKAASYLVTILCILATAYLIHDLVEQRCANFWRALFEAIVGKPIALIRRLSAANPESP